MITYITVLQLQVQSGKSFGVMSL